MIRIRKLEKKDIPFMIEWMSDKELTKYLQNDFEKYANYECQEKFIESSFDNTNKNFAIVNENDEYLGSISLKNIDLKKEEAEYAICLRKDLIGKDISKYATNQILNYAFSVLGLQKVYLYVPTENIRANKFYGKYGFHFDECKPQSLEIKGKLNDINWYSITKDGFYSLFQSKESEMTNVRKVTYPEITDHRGELVALEHPRQLEFPLNRVYYIYNVGDGVIRGRHSHYDLEQILIAVSGVVTVMTKTPYEEREYILNKPNVGLYVGNMVWREMYNFSDDAVLLVLASKKYDENDYIRDYKSYLEEAKEYFENSNDKKNVRKLENK